MFINNTQIDHAKDIDIVKLIYNLPEYSDIYSKQFKHKPLCSCYNFIN